MHEPLDRDCAARTTRSDAEHFSGHANMPLVPLQRLRQIAEELRRAALGNDLEVACAAAQLLVPTLERCNEAMDLQINRTSEIAEAALHIQFLLADCEVLLTKSIHAVAAEMKRIRQGRRTLEMARRQAQAAIRPAMLNSTR